MNMKAAVLTGLGQMEIGEVPVPAVVPGSLLIKVSACAVCGSDIRIFETGNSRVKYPAITGHEMSGEVIEIGKGVEGFNVGDRLAIGADVPCGRCYWCLNGMGNCCDENYAMGYQFQGGFAEYCLLNQIVVQYGPISRIPDGVSMEHAALAEPLACCINGLEKVLFTAGKSVLVMGSGPIGLLLVQAARAFGSPLIILSDTDPKRLKDVEGFGPDHIINSGTESLVDRVMGFTKGKGVDAVFTACPSPDAQEEAVKVVAKRGFVNLFGGLPGNSRDITLHSNTVHYREAYLTGSHGSTPRHHALALDLIASGRIDVSRLITHRYPLSDIKKAFETVKNRKGLKVIVTP